MRAAHECSLEELLGIDRLPDWVHGHLQLDSSTNRIDNWSPPLRLDLIKAYLGPKLRPWISDPFDAIALEKGDGKGNTSNVFTSVSLRSEDQTRLINRQRDRSQKFGLIPSDEEPSNPSSLGLPARSDPAHCDMSLEGSLQRPRMLRGLGIFLNGAGGPSLTQGQAVHGGAIATCLDSIMGQTNVLNGMGGPTAYLTLRYKKPILLNQKARGCLVAAEGRIVKIEKKRKVFLEGILRDGATGVELAVAEALFIHQTDEQMISASQALDHRRQANKFSLTVPSTTSIITILKRSGWVSDNDRAARMLKKSGQQSYLDTAFPRLQRTFWFNPAEKKFAAVVHFSPQCLGPPGRVHGGCQFAVLDDTIAKFLFCRAASDLGLPAGSLVTTYMRVDFKGGVPLDSACLVICRLAKRSIDEKGRTKVRVEAEMSLGGGDKVFSVGVADFVQSGAPWEGQITSKAESHSRL